MSWSLDVYATHTELVQLETLQRHLLSSPTPLSVAPPSSSPEDENSNITWRELQIYSSDEGVLVGRVLAIPFSAESSADPELVPAFEQEIEDADADVHDEEFSSHLRQTLRRVCWHYSISVRQNGRIEQERSVVKVAHALSQLASGLVHDPQTGAWMDAGLFESLLDAYGLEDFS